MHEVSLGNTLRDYLTGEEIKETTYEEFRQALARLLVEELGYPRDRLRAKVEFSYEIDGERYSRSLDLVAYDQEDRPLLVMVFCSGCVGSFVRETAVAARLIAGGPAPLALATDTRDAALIDPASGDVLEQGMRAVPRWEELLRRASETDRTPLDAEQRAKLERIFHAYNGFLLDSCCTSECCGPFKKG
ncbi:MAG: type I restriction enzyme HsdR N-terminal domain-containing protein [Desulfovibrio sp.]